MPWIVEIIGVISLIIAIARTIQGDFTIFASLLLSIIALAYLFVRICATKRWYPGEGKERGIERHFADTLTMTSYLILMGVGLFLFFKLSFLLLLITVIILFFIHFSIALLIFHARDQDPTPANFFSIRPESNSLTQITSVIKTIAS